LKTAESIEKKDAIALKQEKWKYDVEEVTNPEERFRKTSELIGANAQEATKRLEKKANKWGGMTAGCTEDFHKMNLRDNLKHAAHPPAYKRSK